MRLICQIELLRLICQIELLRLIRQIELLRLICQYLTTVASVTMYLNMQCTHRQQAYCILWHPCRRFVILRLKYAHKVRVLFHSYYKLLLLTVAPVTTYVNM